MDFLAKPVDPDHLLLMVERAIAQRRMLTEYIVLKEELAERRGAPRIIGEDGKLRQVSQQLHRAAATDATVLLEGESGTGKELFARALHALSPRADGPFVAINCAAIPEYAARERAVRLREGRVHRRRAAQARTVRAGPSRHALPRRDRRSAARAPGQDPSRARGEAVRARRRHAVASRRRARRRGDEPQPQTARGERQFREDLYFRLSVFPIQIPPLRERGDDVLILARHFVDKFCKDLNKKSLMLSPAALDDLKAYPWPGNVRELQNCIERAVILADGDAIHQRHLNLSFRNCADRRRFRRTRGIRSICRERWPTRSVV